MELASFVKNDRRYRIKSVYSSGPYSLEQLRVIDEDGRSYSIVEFNGQYRISDRVNGKPVNTTLPKAIVNMILGK